MPSLPALLALAARSVVPVGFAVDSSNVVDRLRCDGLAGLAGLAGWRRAAARLGTRTCTSRPPSREYVWSPCWASSSWVERTSSTGRHSAGSPDDTANVAVSFSLAGLGAFVVGVADATTPWPIP